MTSTKMKWKNVGPGMYESGPWAIVRHDGYPHTGTSWAIYKNDTFMDRKWAFKAAKEAVSGAGLGELN